RVTFRNGAGWRVGSSRVSTARSDRHAAMPAGAGAAAARAAERNRAMSTSDSMVPPSGQVPREPKHSSTYAAGHRSGASGSCPADLGGRQVHRRWGRHHVSRGAARIARLAPALVLCAIVGTTARAQDLTPRAYVIAPLRSNAILVTDIFNDGDLNLEGTVPIEDATGTINGVAAAYYRSFGLFGRSANVNVVLPYGTGTFDGIVLGAPFTTHRAGLFDIPIRFAVNLIGGPAMEPGEWMKWQQKTLLGASLKVAIPVGQYDPTKLIN